MCTFIKDFEDDDANKICDDSKDSQPEKTLKLSTYLTSIQKEYIDCEQKEKCKSKMTKS